MMGFIHACVGAGLGSFFRRPSAAFGAGVVSHAVGDVIPHKEAPLAVELVLLAGTLTFIGRRFGVGSPEFAGAVGGVSPDLEHALVLFGLMPESARVFPTHNHILPHGKSDEYISQILAGLAGLAVAERGKLLVSERAQPEAA